MTINNESYTESYIYRIVVFSQKWVYWIWKSWNFIFFASRWFYLFSFSNEYPFGASQSKWQIFFKKCHELFNKVKKVFSWCELSHVTQLMTQEFKAYGDHISTWIRIRKDAGRLQSSDQLWLHVQWFATASKPFLCTSQR